MWPDLRAALRRIGLGDLTHRQIRRLLLVVLMFPGAVLAIAGAQILGRPAWVMLGLAWLTVGAALWRPLTSRLAPSIARSTPSRLSESEEPSP